MKKLSKLNEKKICARFGMALTTAMLMICPAFATSGSDFDTVVNPIITLLNNLLGPILGLVGAIGALYCVLLGVKFAKAEEPQEREKAKTHLKNAIIGFALIFILIVGLKLGMDAMIDWIKTQNVKVTTVPSGS